MVEPTPSILRRRRIRRLPPLLALLLAVVLAATACTGAATPESEVGGDTEATEGTGGGGEVENPDTFVHAVDGEPLSLDPARAALGEYGEQVILQVYETLIDIGPDGPEPVPLLATEVPSADNGLISADGLTYTFPLREGVTFHDGSDFTADDVKYSWERVMTMDLPEGQASRLNEMIAEITVVDDYTVEVVLTQPSAAFITSVVYSTPAMIVSQEAVEANGGVVAGEPNPWMDTNMAGTGAHQFVAWERNERLDFEIFEDYWGEPAALNARWLNVPEESARNLGLQGGDYDAIQSSPQVVEELEGSEGVCLDTEGVLLEPIQIAFNLNIPEGALPDGDTIPTDFFHDRRIRQAFNYTFDYDAFINGVLNGFGQPAAYLPPGVLGYSEDAPYYTQDLERAEQLFREAGVWDEGFTVSVIVEDNAIFAPAGLILKDSLQALNPNFVLNVLTVSESQFDEAHAQTPFQYAMWIKNADPFVDPHFFMDVYWHPEGDWGQRLGYANGYQDPERIAQLIDEAGTSTDIAEREQLYGELLQLLYDNPMWIYPAQENNVQAYRCWVDGFVYNPLWKTLRYRFYDK